MRTACLRSSVRRGSISCRTALIPATTLPCLILCVRLAQTKRMGCISTSPSGFSGTSKPYTGFYQGIIVAGGKGTNSLDFSGVTDLPVEIRGGDGIDTLTGGMGNDTIFGGAGNDIIRGGSGNDFLVGEGGDDMIFGGGGNDRLLGDSGNDTLDGGAGNDALLGGGGSDNLLGGANDDVLFGGESNDTLTVRKAQAAVTVKGGAGTADEFILDLILDANGLVGSLVDNGFTGLGFSVPVTYADDVEQFTVNLGAGVDLLDVNFTTSTVNATVNAKNGDDQITIQSIVGLTSINGDRDSDTVIVPITGDPNLLDDTTYANLVLNVETLRVVHSGAQLTDWRVEDGAVRVSNVPCPSGGSVGCGILNTIGIDRVVIEAGGNSSNTITVANNVPTSPTFTIENNMVDVEVGSNVLDFTAKNQGNFINQMGPNQPNGETHSVVISPNGKNAYIVRPEDGSIEVYDRNTASGDLVFVQELNTGTAGDLLGATALAISADGSRVFVATPAGFLFAFDRDPSSGELTFGTSSTLGLTGADFIKESGHGDQLYIASDSIGGFGTAAGVQGELSGFLVEGIETDTVPTIDAGTVSDPNPMKGQFIPNGVTVTPDGKFIYVSSTGEGIGLQFNPGGVAWFGIDEMATPEVLSFDVPDLGDFIDTPGEAFSTVVSPDGLFTVPMARSSSNSGCLIRRAASRACRTAARSR